MSLSKKIFCCAIASASILSGCSQSSGKTATDNKKTITIAFGLGNYIDQVRGGIVPILEKQGYTVNLKQFSQNRQINPAFQEGSIDASVNQSRAYMEAFNKKNNTDLIALTDSPSAPQSLRSLKHKSLNEVHDGTIVIIPNDPVNAERAAQILQQLGWIKIKANTSPLSFGINDISPAKYKIDVREADSGQSLRLLQDADFAVVNGNYVADAGQKISDGLVVEKTPLQHRVVVAISGKDQNSQWAKDLKAAFESKQYAQYVKSQTKYSGFIFPASWDKYK